jgi:hypothetical protein
MHARWEGNGLRQPDGLAAIASEYRGSSHRFITMYIQLGYTIDEPPQFRKGRRAKRPIGRAAKRASALLRFEISNKFDFVVR